MSTEVSNEFRFSVATFWSQRVCAGCGDPGSDAHHILHRSFGGDDHLDNGLLLCHKCHMLMHDGCWDVQAAIGRTLVSQYPEKIAHVHALLGDHADSFLHTYYKIGSPQ